jgi:hypothetical protein
LQQVEQEVEGLGFELDGPALAAELEQLLVELAAAKCVDHRREIITLRCGGRECPAGVFS